MTRKTRLIPRTGMPQYRGSEIKIPLADIEKWHIAQGNEREYWEGAHKNQQKEEEWKSFGTTRTRMFLERIRFDMAAFQGKKVLEVGSGPAPFVGHLKGIAEGVALDPNHGTETYNKFCTQERLPPHCKAIKGVGEAIPFPNDYFDFVISSNHIDHGYDPLTALKEMLRVGKVVLLDVLIRKKIGVGHERMHPVYFHNVRQIQMLIDAAGGQTSKIWMNGMWADCIITRKEAS